jgi:hypothetical protein
VWIRRFGVIHQSPQTSVSHLKYESSNFETVLPWMQENLKDLIIDWLYKIANQYFCLRSYETVLKKISRL